MEKMKKTLFLLLTLSLCSCTGLTEGAFSKIEKSSNNIWKSKDNLPQEKIPYNNQNSLVIISSISENLKNNKIRTTSDKKDYYEVYCGETLSINLENYETNVGVLSTPKGASKETKIKDGKLFFRSPYQGKYMIEISGNGKSREIEIINKSFYSIDESLVYDNLLENYKSGNIKGLENDLTIHRLAFPDHKRDKELSFLAIELAKKTKNTKLIKDEFNFLNRFSTLNEQEKLLLMEVLNSTKTTVNLNKNFLNFTSQSTELNSLLAKYIITKAAITKDEIEFLELFAKNSDDKDVKRFLGNWYLKNNDTVKGNEYLKEIGELKKYPLQIGNSNNPNFPINIPTNNIPTTTGTVENKYNKYVEFLGSGIKSFKNENYNEAIIQLEKGAKLNNNFSEQKDYFYYLGMSFFKLGNYSKAIQNLKKSINLEKIDEKKAEMYYNIGIAFDKLGDKEQAIRYMTYIKQNFKNTTWNTKGNLYLLENN